MKRDTELMRDNENEYCIKQTIKIDGYSAHVVRVHLSEEEAKQVVAWLMRELPNVPGVPF